MRAAGIAVSQEQPGILCLSVVDSGEPMRILQAGRRGVPSAAARSHPWIEGEIPMIVRRVLAVFALAVVMLSSGCCCKRFCCRRPCCENNCCAASPAPVSCGCAPCGMMEPPMMHPQ